MYGSSLSSALGWVSIACWVVVYTPQFLENYQLQSGEALSVPFVIIWLAGDICNLAGAWIAGLLPTVIILALYYSLCDIGLLFQIYYYRWRKNRTFPPNSPSEETPLLESQDLSKPENRSNLTSTIWLFARYVAGLLFVVGSGVIAWWVSGPGTSGKEGTKYLEWEIQTLGWSSAILFLGARIPQISKNFKTGCEGLSLAMFIFTISGNGTYALSICAASMDRKYLITNASWLTGSLGAIFLDLIIIGQVCYYRSRRESLEGFVPRS